MPRMDLTIETDKEGNHFVVFPRRQSDLTPPRHYDERLEWIRHSFRLFIAKVDELESLRKSPVVN